MQAKLILIKNSKEIIRSEANSSHCINNTGMKAEKKTQNRANINNVLPCCHLKKN